MRHVVDGKLVFSQPVNKKELKEALKGFTGLRMTEPFEVNADPMRPHIKEGWHVNLSGSVDYATSDIAEMYRDIQHTLEALMYRVRVFGSWKVIRYVEFDSKYISNP